MIAVGGCSSPAVRAPRPASSPTVVKGTLRADTLWQGTVVVEDDLLVPRGRTLRIRPGTRVVVKPADTTKTEPEYLDNATEILVRGRLLVEGSAKRPVVFEPSTAGGAEEENVRWGGVVFDGGQGRISHARISGAETGLTLLDSSPAILDLRISDVREGVAIHRGSAPRIVRLRVNAQVGGVSCWPGSSPDLEGVEALAAEHEGLLVSPGSAPRIRDSVFRGGTAGVLWGAQTPPPADLAGVRRGPSPVQGELPSPAAAVSEAATPPFEPRVPPPPPVWTRIYRGEQFIGEDTSWEGEILVDGTVMIAPVAQLTLAPGAVVRFAFRDTDGDGVGESEIFIQGRLLAEGTAAAPIVFTALGTQGPGRWGAINLMGTDAEESRLAWCLVESGLRGLHSHFSRFRVENSVFRNNFRSIQFQESTAAITRTAISASASALRFRDSTAALEDLAIHGNTLGLQILRSSFSLVGSSLEGNALAGMHVRESEGTISASRFSANTPGLRVSDCRLVIEGNRLAANNGAGLQLRRTTGRVGGNLIQGNVGNGVSTDSPGAPLRGNAVVGNLRFALESNTAGAIDAAGNWWGPGGAAADLIFDAADDPRLGEVRTDPTLAVMPAVP